MKNEIISHVLDVVRPCFEAEDEEHGDEIDYEQVIIASLNALPDGVDIKMCNDLHLNVECCESCHTSYPHYEMKLVKLSDGTPAWLCHTVIDALSRKKPSEVSR